MMSPSGSLNYMGDGQMILCCMVGDFCKTSGLFSFFQLFKNDELCIFQSFLVALVIPCAHAEKQSGGYNAEHGKIFGVHKSDW